MKLKHGKKYETADGVVVGPMEVNGDGVNVKTHPFRCGSKTYTINGCYGTGGETSRSDLIRRYYTKPKTAHKLDLKPGDVVELVAWEDGSTQGIGKRYPFDGLPQYPKGYRPMFRVVSRFSYPKPPS
jgi:hypothetical protein